MSKEKKRKEKFSKKEERNRLRKVDNSKCQERKIFRNGPYSCAPKYKTGPLLNHWNVEGEMQGTLGAKNIHPKALANWGKSFILKPFKIIIRQKPRDN